MKELLSTPSYDSFHEANAAYFINFNHYFQQLLKQKKLKKSHVIDQSMINPKYAYQIFSGKRTLTRDKAIMLAFGAGLDLEETQVFLKYASHLPLYPKVKRDALIIVALNQRMTVMDANDYLYQYKEALLEWSASSLSAEIQPISCVRG